MAPSAWPSPGGAGTAGLISVAVLEALGSQGTLPNVVLYPHHASGTGETRDRMAQLTLDNLDAFFAGRPLLTPGN